MPRTTLTRAALALLLAAAGAGWASTAALAAPHDGPCTDASGVTVVVDFQELGGGTVVRCAPDVEPGQSGLSVLGLAGFTTEGTVRDGPGFVCRINNTPTIDQPIPIRGNEDYRETCVNTAPNEAHWTYWHAPNGGPWSYSQAGAANRAALTGGYEGWSFSLNRSRGDAPPPRVAPRHDVVAPEPTPTPMTATPTTATPTPAAPAPATPTPTTTAPDTPAPAPATSTARAATPTPDPATRPATHSPAPSPEPEPTATATSASPTTPEISRPASPTATESPPSTTTAVVEDDGGPSPGTWLGIGAVAAIAVAGAVVWRLRRQ